MAMIGVQRFLPRERFGELFTALTGAGYQIVGPTIPPGVGAIVYDDLRSVDDLPTGWTDEQSAGKYRLARRDDDAYFGYVVGPHSWKKYLFPPQSLLSTSEKGEDGWTFATPTQDPPRLAFLGVRACELAAIAVQDRVFLGGSYVDPIYQARRERIFLVAVNCTQAGANCFCTSMQTGPQCRTGFDLALTELSNGFVIEIGSDRGAAVLTQLATEEASTQQDTAAAAARDQAVQQTTKTLDTDGIRDLLLTRLDHPRWNEVADRCLSCTNCTMVCPTCFCSSVQEVPNLDETHVERNRVWDSCFNIDFSAMGGGIVRDSVRSRYRQWLTHKLASWHDQFGSSGCVGCGRCITWCPVGIDLTEEVAAIRKEPA